MMLHEVPRAGLVQVLVNLVGNAAWWVEQHPYSPVLVAGLLMLGFVVAAHLSAPERDRRRHEREWRNVKRDHDAMHRRPD